MKLWIKIVLCFLVVAIATTATYVVYSNKQKATLEGVYKNLVVVIDDFNSKIAGLSPSRSGKEALEAELAKMKDIAIDSDSQLNGLYAEAYSIKTQESMQLQQAINLTRAYFKSFSSISNQKITADDLKAGSNDLVNQLKICKDELDCIDIPASQDMNISNGRASQLVLNFNKSLKQETPQVVRVIASDYPSNGYWVDTRYNNYRERILSIVARYSEGRKILGHVMDDIDRGRSDSNDVAAWKNELDKRCQLLNELDDLKSSIPPGSIYAEHHQMLTDMLKTAIPILQNYGQSQTIENRQAVHNMSADNTRTMNQLKAFYGVK